MRAKKFRYSKSKIDHNLQQKIQVCGALDLFCHDKPDNFDEFEGPEVAFLVAYGLFH